jgi:hypothetical protein
VVTAIVATMTLERYECLLYPWMFANGPAAESTLSIFVHLGALGSRVCILHTGVSDDWIQSSVQQRPLSELSFTA